MPDTRLLSSTDLKHDKIMLMPFHIDYNGPAPILDKFLPLNEGKDQAAFRGRLTHASTLELPTDYTGLVLQASVDLSIKQFSGRNTRKRPLPRAIMPEPKKVKRTSPRKMAARASAKPAFSLDTPPSSPVKESPRTSPRRSSPAKSVIEEVEEEPEEVLIEEEEEEEPLEPDVIDLKPISTFDSIQFWAPDAPLDAGGDVFWRSINEWTQMAELVGYICAFGLSVIL